jgi:hypothetical protein
VTLSTTEYEISGFDLPEKANAAKLHLTGLLYEDLYEDEKEIDPQLQIIVNNLHLSILGIIESCMRAF